MVAFTSSCGLLISFLIFSCLEYRQTGLVKCQEIMEEKKKFIGRERRVEGVALAYWVQTEERIKILGMNEMDE